MFEVNPHPSTRELRRFALLVPAVLVGLGVLSRRMGGHAGGALGGRQVAAILLWILAAVIVTSPAISSEWTRRIYLTWMRLGTGVGSIMSSVVLAFMYCILLPPFALIRRGDPLRYRLEREGSYWEPSSRAEPTLERMRRLF